VSAEIHRTVGVLIDRRGDVEHVIVGDGNRLYLPDIGRQRAGTTRLRGLRLLRTQLTEGEPTLTREDLTDLAKLRLDLVGVLEVLPAGYAGRLRWAHLQPAERGERPAPAVHGPVPLADLEDTPFSDLVGALEEELGRKSDGLATTGGIPAVLVYVRQNKDWFADERIAELHELCRTAGLQVVETVMQSRFKMDPRTVVGSDKLEEIELLCLDVGAEVVLFGHDLTPAQARAVTDRTELKVIDRTQLILDIFAQHAQSSDGKLQVELAQLKYMMPRLGAKNTGLSRLTGGVGGRGPGETKLELNRRRARDRVRRLEEEVDKLSDVRVRKRQQRQNRSVPVVAIVGYTNAGKSTLLNSLTNAEVRAENLLFATLDPTSRRLRFPEDRELVLTDTVGFIHDLPPTLTKAFKATLEELEDATLLIHLVDISTEGHDRRMEAVNGILDELGLAAKPQLLVFNKADRVEPELAQNLAEREGAIAVSALDPRSLTPLVAAMQMRLWSEARQGGAELSFD
jgi:GTP-binding protein HflX